MTENDKTKACLRALYMYNTVNRYANAARVSGSAQRVTDFYGSLWALGKDLATLSEGYGVNVEIDPETHAIRVAK